MLRMKNMDRKGLRFGKHSMPALRLRASMCLECGEWTAKTELISGAKACEVYQGEPCHWQELHLTKHRLQRLALSEGPEKPLQQNQTSWSTRRGTGSRAKSTPSKASRAERPGSAVFGRSCSRLGVGTLVFELGCDHSSQ